MQSNDPSSHQSASPDVGRSALQMNHATSSMNGFMSKLRIPPEKLSQQIKRPRPSFWDVVLDTNQQQSASSLSIGSPAPETSSRPNKKAIGESGGPHPCEWCDKTFLRAGGLRSHVWTVHGRKKPFVCEMCSMSFGHISSKYRHVRTVHLKRRDFRCTRCGLSFGEKSGLSKHGRTVHEGDRPYPCSICGFRFHFKLHLTQHTTTVHEKLRPHTCLVCKSTFGQRSSLNRHRRQIHGEDTRKGAQDKDSIVRRDGSSVL